ncbi:conserved hypothetical protein [Candidatus Desulfosporosinus infrequens]|uniref:Phage protein n=1 Tax=Candidatus Desulfosporosinus infrequens TaxID=2043169 RepID=A0A2U3LS28_9FIRM|nr:conserved hypothetical protein [Candidatus Desulfosporosinus infrequens]
MDKDSRYNQIQDELTKLFKDVQPEQMQLANRIIQRIAFMHVTLEDLEEDIKANGTYEQTKTRPHKIRERPVVKTYNAMIKNYNATIKQLVNRLSTQKNDEADDELLVFLSKYR